MARLSRADQVIIEESENLIRRIQERAGVHKSIKQVLADDPILLGESLMVVRLVTELNLKTDDPVLSEFILDATA